jgi:hypothetical protein
MHLGLNGPLCLIIWYQLRRALSLYQSSRWPPDLKSSGSKKGTQIYYPFHSKSRQVNLLQVPHWGPYGERYLLTGHFYVSHKIFLFIFFSESPVREPPPCSLTGSPCTGILCHWSQWSVYLFIHSFIHSFICVCLPEYPKRSPSTYEEKHKVTVHGAPCRRKAYIQWGVAWFPKPNECMDDSHM